MPSEERDTVQVCIEKMGRRIGAESKEKEGNDWGPERLKKSRRGGCGGSWSLEKEPFGLSSCFLISIALSLDKGRD